MKLSGTGSPWHFASIYLESVESEPNELWQINHTINNEINFVYHDGLTSWLVGMTLNKDGLLGLGRIPQTNLLEVEGDASKTTAGDWLANSDYRIKTDILEIQDPYETILQLRPVSFKYSESYRNEHPGVEDKTYYNFIAQEFRDVFPDAVKGSGEYIEGDPEEILQMDSYPAQVITVKAVQELILQVQEQQQMILELKAEIERMKRE